MPKAAANNVQFWIAWLPLIVLPAMVVGATWHGVPRWGIMWGVSVTLYFSVKWLIWRSEARSATTIVRLIGWWIAWPGMDASRFLSLQSVPDQKPHRYDWWRGVFVIAAGCALLGAALGMVSQHWAFGGAWLGMFAIVFILHFGAFQILSCLWRSAGADARPIMNRPLASHRVAEFWGQRWNLAFRDAAHVAVFRPIARRYGAASVPLDRSSPRPTLNCLCQLPGLNVSLAGDRDQHDQDQHGQRGQRAARPRAASCLGVPLVACLLACVIACVVRGASAR